KSAPRGDQYAVIKIIVPKNIDDKAREALEVLGQAYEKGEDGR
nr:molecular chaperone DnaJ [bacterium]